MPFSKKKLLLLLLGLIVVVALLLALWGSPDSEKADRDVYRRPHLVRRRNSARAQTKTPWDTDADTRVGEGLAPRNQRSRTRKADDDHPGAALKSIRRKRPVLEESDALNSRNPRDTRGLELAVATKASRLTLNKNLNRIQWYQKNASYLPTCIPLGQATDSPPLWLRAVPTTWLPFSTTTAIPKHTRTFAAVW